MTPGFLVSAWLVGALGGAHCAAMCGGLVSAIAARDAACGARGVFLRVPEEYQREASAKYPGAEEFFKV